MFGETMAQIINLFFMLFNLLILARILASWFNPDPTSPMIRFLHNATEPVLAPVRRLLPPTGMLDISPMVVLIGSFILEAFLISLVRSLF